MDSAAKDSDRRSLKGGLDKLVHSLQTPKWLNMTANTKMKLASALVGAALVGLVGWRFAISGSANGDKPGAGKAPVVMLAPVTSREFVQLVESVGNVVSPYKVEISPKIAGKIEFLTAREGDSVKEGELLLKIDPSDLQDAVLQQQAAVDEARSRLAQAQLTSGANDVQVYSQVHQQRAGLQSAQADLDQTEKNYDAQVATAEAQLKGAAEQVKSAQASVEKEQATLHSTESHLGRTENLYSKGFLAAQDLDDARTAVDVQKAAVNVAQSQLSSANSQCDVQNENLKIVRQKGQADIAASKARLAQANASFEVASANRSQSPAYRQNIAALKSQLDAMLAQVGQAKARLADTEVKSSISGTVTARKADPGGLATPGAPVLEVQFLDWLFVDASLPLEDGAKVHKGDWAEVRIDALPGKVFRGPIENLNSAADPQSRQFSVNIRLDNAKHEIRPGMFANVRIVVDRHQAVVVPNEALTISSSGETCVAVVDAANVAHIRTVTLGAKDDSGAVILSGLKPGERVSVLSFNPVKDGQTVSPSKIPWSPGSKQGAVTP